MSQSQSQSQSRGTAGSSVIPNTYSQQRNNSRSTTQPDNEVTALDNDDQAGLTLVDYDKEKGKYFVFFNGEKQQQQTKLMFLVGTLFCHKKQAT